MKIFFSKIFFSRIPKPVGLSQEWIKKNFMYQEPEFYSRFFNKSEKIHFEVTPWRTKAYIFKKVVPDAPKLYVFQ